MSFNLSVKYNKSSVIKDTADDDIEALQNISAGFGIAGLCFITLGIVGNIIAIVVLRHKPKRCLGTKLLVYLAFVNILLLVFQSIRSVGNLQIGKVVIRALKELTYVTHPLFMTVYMAEICMTSLITVQRYVSVAKPLAANSLMSERRLVIIMAVLGAWCVIFNIPHWFMFYPNILIVRTVKQHTQFRQSQQMENQSDNPDIRLTIIVIAITTLSLINTSLSSIYFVFLKFLNWKTMCSFECFTFDITVNFVVILNCSLNCIFNCVCGSKFRQICWGLFCPKCKNKGNGS
ncbi:neuromedin-U receptor 2-like [Gigantopelta aegis]|uniref:neuromedin-U receptor 2-like n=1 Tax=Gigantopelta aegis TaxID=1735272 RepID=UPI001B88D18A|nr:neuromedin-U receptor 2-like [Gigantopelta aegis]